jgi:hypothetical protein
VAGVGHVGVDLYIVHEISTPHPQIQFRTQILRKGSDLHDRGRGMYDVVAWVPG